MHPHIEIGFDSVDSVEIHHQRLADLDKTARTVFLEKEPQIILDLKNLAVQVGKTVAVNDFQIINLAQVNALGCLVFAPHNHLLCFKIIHQSPNLSVLFPIVDIHSVL